MTFSEVGTNVVTIMSYFLAKFFTECFQTHVSKTSFFLTMRLPIGVAMRGKRAMAPPKISSISCRFVLRKLATLLLPLLRFCRSTPVSMVEPYTNDCFFYL